jgi:hypothetical protein
MRSLRRRPQPRNSGLSLNPFLRRPAASTRASLRSLRRVATGTGNMSITWQSSPASSAAARCPTRITFATCSRKRSAAEPATNSPSPCAGSTMVHRVGNEAAWWKDLGIDPVAVARRLQHLRKEKGVATIVRRASFLPLRQFSPVSVGCAR